jgi:quinol monooxygenase YgiN
MPTAVRFAYEAARGRRPGGDDVTMGGHYASGNWHVKEEKEQEFVERWTEFLRWTRSAYPSLVSASLIRDQGDPRHFVSFADWGDAESRDAWKQVPEFIQRFTACRELCDDFYGSDYALAVSI